MKEMEEFFRLLKEDDELITRAVSGFNGYCTALEDVCRRDVDHESILSIVEVSEDLTRCFDIPSRYNEFSNLDELSPGMIRKLERIKHLEHVLEQAVAYVIQDIGSQWREAKKHVEEWQPRFGVDDIVGSRERMNSVARLYEQLSQGLGFGEDARVSRFRVSEIEDYISFLENVAQVDKELELFKSRYQGCDNLSAEETNVFQRDLLVFFNRYKAIVKRYKSRFDCQERFVELEDVGSGPNQSSAWISGVKQQVQEWIDTYKDTLEYLSRGCEINIEHVEMVARFELADPSLVDIWKQSGDEQLTELLDLESSVVDRISQEVLRIKHYLDRRVEEMEHIYLAEARDFEGMQGFVSRLEDSIQTIDEFILMYKLLWEPTTKVNDLKERARKRVEFYNYSIEEKERERAVRLRSGYPQYVALIARAKEELQQIGERHKNHGSGVLIAGDIEMLYTARDMCYFAMNRMGFEVPVEEIEDKISDIMERDKTRIESFAEEYHQGEDSTRACVRNRARVYMDSIKAWTKHGGENIFV